MTEAIRLFSGRGGGLVVDPLRLDAHLRSPMAQQGVRWQGAVGDHATSADHGKRRARTQSSSTHTLTQASFTSKPLTSRLPPACLEETLSQ